MKSLLTNQCISKMTQTVLFTNMYKDILFLHDILNDNRDNEDYWIFWVGYLKVNKIKAAVVL